jgi:hypothetical protein
LEVFDYNSSTGFVWQVATTQVFRDPSAWYHIVVDIDTTQATASNRVKIFVNGVQVTSLAVASYPSLNFDTSFNYNVAHYIGTYIVTSSYFDGYLTEVNFIDGQALTPSSFGETDAVTGVWKPKKYAGTYGTNGFYLNFSDNSAATAAAIGKDSSGNGNNWTPNNISVTAGVTYDSMIDVPTMYADGGNGRGNYCVMNPLAANPAGYLVASNGNLTVTESSGAAAWHSRWATVAAPSGKWYAEFSCSYSGTTSLTSQAIVGLHDASSSATYCGQTATSYGYQSAASKLNNGGSAAYGSTWGSGDLIQVAYDVDNGKVWFGKNGVWQASGDPAAGTNPAYTSVPANLFFGASTYWITPDGVTTLNANFGQRPFAYTPPTGFKALNTQNLPDSTIKKGNQYFDATTYTGNGSTQSIVNSGAMQPDLVWVKSRSNAYGNYVNDSVRGANQYLETNATSAEGTAANSVTSFNSGGFSLGSNLVYNGSGLTYVGWQWKESVSAGFDIVTYTGNGTSQNIAHSLGVAPKMIITKNRGGVAHWGVYHASIGAANALYLSLTNASSSTTNWNNTAPTSSVFSVGTAGEANASGQTYVAYLFAEVAGYSKFGSYTGNGSADGPFVYCGFRPKFILTKCTSALSEWVLTDTSRATYNAADTVLFPNKSDAENVGVGYTFDVLSNGFKCRGSGSATNGSGSTYIYAAFAENPFKNSLAR